MQPIETMQALFLRQSMQDCWADYQYVCEHPRAMTWDDLVLTASNEAQAQAYRLQLKRRVEQGLLPRQTAYHVVADPEGQRVGSGGSTLHVLRQLALGREKPFESRRILVLHSGGDSQRIPQYSACGKLFSRVPRALPDGRASTLFDESMIALAGIPNRMAGGMLVLSGDVLLLFNTLQIDLERSGAACLTVKAPVDVGVNHGVFLPDDRGFVRRFLHKQSEQTLRALGAVNAQDAIDIDTGAIWL
ncbi:MAG TPA: L-fucokinase, partial [Clostridia bacterium]|nr:L-fucokinase [Clostridia bacterium]